jgi:anti-sigma-K factor RskA
MATSDQEQQSILVPMHKRMAQGAKLDGTSMQPKGGSKTPAKPTGGLSHLKKQK